MNNSNNTYVTLEKGCIKISGTPCATPGQYRVHIFVTINAEIGPLDLVSEGLVYFLRVNNTGDTITPVDSVGLDFLSYNQSTTGCTVGINNIDAVVSSLSLYPNPMSSSMHVKFNSINTGQMTERITNIIGAQVQSTIRNVHAGTNTFVVDRNSLPAGVYFY